MDERKAGRGYGVPDDDTPELSEETIRNARPLSEIPAAKEFLAAARRGRPRLPDSQRKKRVSLHLDPDVIEALKKDGKGWQTRANAKLREALGL